MPWSGIPEDRYWARDGHAGAANPLILVITGDHSGSLKSLFSLSSSGVRDVGVAGSNPVTPTIIRLTFSALCAPQGLPRSQSEIRMVNSKDR